MADVADRSDERLLAAFIGPNWDRYYRERFARFREHPWQPVAWNWAAALVPFWPVYRRLGLATVVYAALGSAFVWGLAPRDCGAVYPVVPLVAGAVACLLEGLFGTWALHRKARSVVARARQQAVSVEYALVTVRSSGLAASWSSIGGRVISTALAALGLLFLATWALSTAAWYSPTRWRAYQAAVKSDLRNHLEAQQGFRDSTRRFAADLSELGSDQIALSRGVQIRVVEADSNGFSAIGTHTLLTDRCGIRCAIFGGTARPPWQGMVPNEPMCLRGTP